MGFDARDRFQVVDEAVSDFVKLPDVVEPPFEAGRFFFEFFSESAFVSERGKQMVEHFVVSDDPFVRGTSFETRNFFG